MFIPNEKGTNYQSVTCDMVDTWEFFCTINPVIYKSECLCHYIGLLKYNIQNTNILFGKFSIINTIKVLI